MNKTRHYIRILLLVLLLGGMANGAWAETRTVTYHVITLPFCDESTNNIAWRIEAIKKKVTCDSEDEIILPADLKSPLMKYAAYSYYDAVNQSGLINIFPDNESQFYTYDFIGKTPLPSGTKVGDRTDIYVTYDWADTNKREEYGKKLDLTGHKTYNIEFRTNAGSWFYGLNMDDDRGNRGQSVPAEYINALTDLCSDNPVRIKQPARNKYNFYFKWKLTNNDPYNIIIKTATNTGINYKEDGYYKNNGGSQLYGSLESSTKIRSNWVTNEVNRAYDDKNKIHSVDRHGWFRGLKTPWGRNGRDNGAINHLYFSFSLLNRSTASEGDYTLAASWVKVDGDDWVPNSSGQYLLMQHEPVHDLPYAGPKFMDFSSTDQVQFHEIRDYRFNVKTPFYPTAVDATDFEKKEHTVSAPFRMSDYAAESLLTDFVPDSLKRKYTTIDGAYKESTLENKFTTFQNAIDNNKAVIDVNGIIQIWLKYSVSSPKPFETYTPSTPFADLKWYNLYVNKEEKYTTWYDDNDTPENKTDDNFFTKDDTSASGHTKYAHESHFAFIGDPYEFYVVNRQASEDASNTLQYLKLGATTTDPLVSGTSGTFTYRPVPNGTTLTIGNTYYTSDGGDGVFIYEGKVANGSNYYEEKYRYDPVASSTTLTLDNYYYRSSAGDGTFKALGTEVADGSNYYELVTYYDPVADGTNLTVGNTYYTSVGGAGKFIYAYEVANGTNYFEKKFDATWEIINDNNSGNFATCFRLRQFNSFGNPVTIGWGASGSRPLNGDGGDGTNLNKVARLWVKDLPFMDYTYYVVDYSGRIAVKATTVQISGSTLSLESLPEIIRSPFLAGSTLTFMTYKSKALFDGLNGDVSSNYNFRTEYPGDPSYPPVPSGSEKLTTITSTNSLEGAANEYLNHIFVFYPENLPAMDEPDGVPLQDDNAEAHSFNVIVNNDYIYYDNTDGIIKSKANFNNDGDASSHPENLWVLGGNDPYAFYIRNQAINKYVLVENKDGKPKWDSDKVLGWTGSFSIDEDDIITFSLENATRFIAKSGTVPNTYEVMATTGIEVDASDTYYNIGRTDDHTVRMYSDEEYEHGYSVIRFQLKKFSAKKITYHLIDKFNQILLSEDARQASDETPQIPAEYFSPLVKEYTYWKENPLEGDGNNATIDNSKEKYAKNDEGVTTERFDQYYTGVGSNPSWDGDVDVYITYEANDKVDMKHTTMYLIKFAQGEEFYQENGSDNLLTKAEKNDPYISKAVYPYCNGDGNLNIYGEYQYNTQQEGAASTRTRWAWYVESSTNDPYHVKILTRQTETYKGLERSGYLATMQFDGYPEVVNTLVWPNISGVIATDYMVLGSDHQYLLMTSYEVDKKVNEDVNDDGEIDDKDVKKSRYVVDSFEQYWKTYDLIRRNVLKQSKSAYPDNPSDPATVPKTPCLVTGFTDNREYLTSEMGWHAYNKMAYAKRWNGYNKNGETKKGWESIEHWFQTVSMGSGYFDLIPTTIDAALILLDQHGWEIIRKPLPSGPDDPNKEKKYEVLRQWDSPMVKEYIFWASAKKRSGFHQYYLLDKRIGGSDFSSPSLTQLPDWDSENVKDSKGNHQDEYVTYIVKDEYAQSYNPGTKAGAEFLIRQGNHLAKKGSGSSVDKIDVDGTNGVSQYIISNIASLNDELWYVKPNADIDTEQGYTSSNHNWGTTNPNAYEDPAYANSQVAVVIEGASDDDIVKKYGRFSFSNGFDPYNIQISTYSGAQYMTMAMTSAKVEDGMNVGDYTGGSTNITQGGKNANPATGNGYDNGKWAMTNQTFMAVMDAEGNMQLMPRFDHNLRMRDFSTLVTPTEEAAEPTKLFETQTQLYRPFVYNYRIIDNDGRESMRYQSGGNLVPQTPAHLKSPLAKDFKYYHDLTPVTGGYSLVNIGGKEITGSLAGAGLTTPSVTNANPVYVRYDYDEEADVQHILQGKWLTMQLNAKDVHYTSGIRASNGAYALTATDDTDYGNQKSALTTEGIYYFRIGEGPSYTYKKVTVTVSAGVATAAEVSSESSDWEAAKPVVQNVEAKEWQWKFLRNSYLKPDPYAVQVFNRNEKDKPMSVAVAALNGGSVTAQPYGAEGYYQRFVLLAHSDLDDDGKADTYALAVAGTGTSTGSYAYSFLNGYNLASSVAVIAEDKAKYNDPQERSGFTSTSDIFHGTDSRVQLFDDVSDDYKYQVYTNDDPANPSKKYGVFAIDCIQSYSEVQDNQFVPKIPEEIRSPLLNIEDFVYYENETDMGASGRELHHLYGLYDNNVFVRYTYKPDESFYKVPNARNDKGSSGDKVAKGTDSNDSPLRFSDKLLYNIIWYDDIMMKSNSANDGIETNISTGDIQDQDLKFSEQEYQWHLLGNDPYAIKIRNVKVVAGKECYVKNSTTVCATCSGTGTVDTPSPGASCGACDGFGYTGTCTLSATDYTSFMLLNKDGYEYGMLAETGHQERKLTHYGDKITESSAPNQFIIFALSTYKVIYHLVIANIGDTEAIPYRKDRDNGEPYTTAWTENDRKLINGTTKRDLSSTYQLGVGQKNFPFLQKGEGSTWTWTNTGENEQYYCVDAGHISLGETLTVPEEFYRPNVVYTFFVHHIQAQDGSENDKTNLLNTKYKGLEIKTKKMSLDQDLLNKTVYINIVYSFNGNLDSNSGDNFVLGVDENKWYTIETMISGKPWLAQYTNAWGFELKEGRGSHYTNDFLWTPIGDPYGFQLFNRYMDVNSGDDNLGEKDRVIFSREFNNPDEHKGGQQILMGNYQKDDKLVVVGGGSISSYDHLTVAKNSIYELLTPTDPDDITLQGYFRFHPVANTKEQTQVYFNPAWADDDNDDLEHHANNRLVRLSPTAANFTFRLSKDLIKPYFDRAGYVGGLKKTVYDELDENKYNESDGRRDLVNVMKDDSAEPTFAQLMAAQKIVYDFNNTVPFATGYYRLHSPLGISDIDPVRYVSGYTHKIEVDGFTEGSTIHNDPIPMHFYEMNSEQVRQFVDFKDGGFTESPATRGDITIPPVERDPASIFYFEKIGESEIPQSVPASDKDRYNLTTISTQDLYIKGEKGKVTVTYTEGVPTVITEGEDKDKNLEDNGERPAAWMTESKDYATKLFVMDLGGGVLLIHDNVTQLGRRYLKYLSYDKSNDEPDKPTIYDMKLTNHTHTDHAKFCMQPVQSAAKKGVNEMGLKFTTTDYTLNNGGDGYYYTTFYAPYDVLLTDDKNDFAYICEVWDTEMLHLRKVGRYNKVTNGLPEKYKKYEGCNQFVPAGTPVIVRSSNTSVTMALPTTEPSTTLANYYKTKNIFSGVCLEQQLDTNDDIYVFGLPFEEPTKVTKHDKATGEIVISLPTSADEGVGFFINANYNRETAADMGSWIRNNRYVNSNKIYISIPQVSTSRQTRSPEFIPVVFDDDEEEEDEPIGESLLQRPHDNRVYDLLGRCVASGEEVVNGTWRSKVASGIYILNGRKIYVK